MASTYNALGNAPQAIAVAEQGLAIARAIKSRQGEGSALGNLGDGLLKAGKFREAESALRAAIAVWESMRAGLNDQNKVSLAETQASLYPLLQEALVQQNRAEAALEVAEQGRARAFADLLTARLQGNVPEQFQDLTQAPTLDAIRQIAKTQKATLVEYSILRKDLLYIWVIKPNGDITFHSTKLDKVAPLQQLMTESRGAINRNAIARKSRNQIHPVQTPTVADSEFDQILTQLHQTLIAPIAASLPTDPQQRVIFLPQGELFLVPFPALKDAKGHYLIEHHTISTAPSIHTLELTREQAKRSQANGHVLVVGDPVMPRWQNQQLAPLTGARQEAIEIAALFKTQPLLGAQATKAAVLQQIHRASIVHLATHGLLNTAEGDIPGAIALAPQGQDSGLLTAREIFDLKLNSELVVLSACDTGRGNITGDGVMGLSRSLIAAGVPSVVVSLWAVDDHSTRILMSDFYHQLQNNPNKAQAMRQAMLTTMQQYPNPWDWAAFTLVGESDR